MRKYAFTPVLAFVLLSGCAFYTPSSDVITVQVRSDEAYYAGFFRACEILSNRQVEGIYIQVSEHANLESEDQCLQLTQQMIDHNAASSYSNNWPGMTQLSLKLQNTLIDIVYAPH